MNWCVPLSDIDIGEAEIGAVNEVLESRWLSMGGVTEEFEAAFAQQVGVRYAFAVTNCTAALHLAYAALEIGSGDQVIVPSLSFVATANAVTYTGAEPVFADVIAEHDLTIDPEDVERKITPRTKAIAVMHYGGYPCHMDAINRIAQQHNLAVVEDAAHAPGARYRGQACGALGDIAAFSFFSNKNLVTGEGGMITTNRADLAERIRLMRSHGMTTLTWERHKGHAYSYDVVTLGYNYRIDEMRSAIGLVQLEKLEANNRLRLQHVAKYRTLLDSVPGVTLPFAKHEDSAGHIMPIVLAKDADRLQFVDRLKAQGIQTSMHYPPIHLFSYYRDQYGTHVGTLPQTESIAMREVTLPLFPTMSTAQVELVATAVKSSI